jgi:hypothetical protein
VSDSAKASAQSDKPEAGSENAAGGRPAVRWDDRAMQTAFANVVNVQSTREQVDLFFGTNQTWNVASGDGVTVELTNRMILTPVAAKRLWIVLGNVLKEYESRHGPLNVEK